MVCISQKGLNNRNDSTCCFIAFMTPDTFCLPDASKILTGILGNTRDLQPLIT